MGKLLPVIIAVVGLAVGGGAGFLLKPAPPPPAETDHAAAEGASEDGAHASAAEAHGDAASSTAGHGASGDDGAAVPEYAKLNNQFVVPVIRSGKVAALVVMSISLEVPSGSSEFVFEREPRLRDAFLQVLFDHANAGGFDGAFTESGNLTLLRRALLESSQSVLGRIVSDILITDLVRQDA
ncbi:flagellar basal body-associated protein FliL [Rhodovulum sulfidophilum]|uniref:Flagellar protein FliL n=1 Tax=Rhodovulum visakhapatnamense TaxID=364297 RepID=A0ABS1RGS9_9RHOB|nr:flagellar basal body-associated FliL family protein [Rhodovulum visakhapatnamense]MBL3568957.1 flagellar basal body-associated FliL family protein [Rhodovulum visakhapatnamense]MBL3578112.1 flagellar basal body-associated FliL family protein [Rhodovulum visakhapatnamense]OLS43649.1 flagellar basal body-associated protein FliL [Rhodovulum sulfidophilum]